jgi:hypothetical protein
LDRTDYRATMPANVGMTEKRLSRWLLFNM